MVFIFSDSFDWYTSTTNDLGGYWDSGGTSSATLSTGRFSSSQAWRFTSNAGSLFKNSATNDATHHLVIAFEQTTSASGSTSCQYFSLGDGGTAQCSIVFRSDGTILLTSGTFNGSTLATYSNAFSANLWTAFEFEITIDNANGAFRARKNGNTSNDFAATGLNTRGGTSNSYANRLIFACNSTSFLQWFDDLLWFSTSGAAPNTWVGDVRAASLMPATDSSIQFSKNPTNSFSQGSASTVASTSYSSNNLRITAVTAAQTGVLASLTVNLNASATGHAVMGLYDATSGNLLATSAVITNPASGVNTFTVSGGPTVTRSTSYYVGILSDVALTILGSTVATIGVLAFVYSAGTLPSNYGGASFTSNNNGGNCLGMNITPTSYTLVNEAQEDGTSSYVYDNTVGHADFYTISTIPTTSTVTVVTTRGFIAKSDAGFRTAQVQLNSNGTTVQSTALVLSTSFQWVYRTDTVDPHTNNPWLATNVNAITIGPLVSS